MKVQSAPHAAHGVHAIRWATAILAAAILACPSQSAEPPLPPKLPHPTAPHHKLVPDWPRLPKDHVLGLCSGVGVDAQNRVFVFHRSGRSWTTPFPKDPISEPTLSILKAESGELLASWGAQRFVMPHGLHVDHEGNLWLTDVALHQVFKLTPEGTPLLTLGEAGVPGCDADHFAMPTDVAVLSDGSFCVSDGYRNSRVARFDAQGKFLTSWGSKGTGPGQLQLPHGIAADAHDRLYVCDRSNSRIQLFDSKGSFLAQWSGPHIGRPYGISVSPTGTLFAIDGGDPALPATQRGKVVELDAEGRLLDSFGAPGSGPGQFQTGHDIAVGPDGSVYVAEGAGARVQKFVPLH